MPNLETLWSQQVERRFQNMCQLLPRRSSPPSCLQLKKPPQRLPMSAMSTMAGALRKQNAARQAGLTKSIRIRIDPAQDQPAHTASTASDGEPANLPKFVTTAYCPSNIPLTASYYYSHRPPVTDGYVHRRQAVRLIFTDDQTGMCPSNREESRSNPSRPSHRPNLASQQRSWDVDMIPNFLSCNFWR